MAKSLSKMRITVIVLIIAAFSGMIIYFVSTEFLRKSEAPAPNNDITLAPPEVDLSGAWKGTLAIAEPEACKGAFTWAADIGMDEDGFLSGYFSGSGMEGPLIGEVHGSEFFFAIGKAKNKSGVSVSRLAIRGFSLEDEKLSGYSTEYKECSDGPIYAEIKAEKNYHNPLVK